MGITVMKKPLEVVGCLHSHGVLAFWDYEEGKAPCLVFSGMPTNAAVVMMTGRIIVCCRLCLSNLPNLKQAATRLHSIG